MATGKLYTYPDNFRAFKILIAAQYSGAKITLVQDPPSFKFGETNKSPEFLSKFPLGKVPAFEGNDGVCLFESNAIAYYVANSQLRGEDTLSQAYVQLYVNFADSEILPAACNWVFPTLGIMQFNKGNTERAKEDIKKALGYLDEVLKTRTFLVGERVTLADISVACNLLLLYKSVLDPQFRAPFRNVTRWFTTVVNQPQAKAVLGEVQLCEKMAQFDAKKFAELSGKKDKKKEEKEAKKESKKESKKAQPKAAKPDEDEEEERPPPAPKEKKDPFADLPPPTMDMDAFKRSYSNEDTLTKALPHFWEHFDKENYSIWHAEYLFPEQLKLIFMSCNLVGGMYQRLEKMRKHAFASVIIFGEDNNSTISGVWFWRGQNLIFKRSDDWDVDYESYKWTKLDPDAPETKKMVEEYFCCEGEFDGKKVASYKIYK
ncbi:elongation factor 1-gamma-A-like [Acanthaster planci]|uniref:Elongation factor 1-gamma-A-like n=1 Tax=Acanthaster planci TaxID=133434 RepID=A0A8B7Z3I0_ACAPL|nr:elongation factor 1-gamma-A-like [Acanthaster planci]